MGLCIWIQFDGRSGCPREDSLSTRPPSSRSGSRAPEAVQPMCCTLKGQPVRWVPTEAPSILMGRDDSLLCQQRLETLYLAFRPSEGLSAIFIIPRGVRLFLGQAIQKQSTKCSGSASLSAAQSTAGHDPRQGSPSSATITINRTPSYNPRSKT